MAASMARHLFQLSRAGQVNLAVGSAKAAHAAEIATLAAQLKAHYAVDA